MDEDTGGTFIVLEDENGESYELELLAEMEYNGETFKLDHTDDGKRSLLRCKIGSRSVMAKRTAGSSNDLFIDPGVQAVSYTAGGSGIMELSCAGRFG